MSPPLVPVFPQLYAGSHDGLNSKPLKYSICGLSRATWRIRTGRSASEGPDSTVISRRPTMPDSVRWSATRATHTTSSRNRENATLQRKCHLCIPLLGIAWLQSKFPHSCVCERLILYIPRIGPHINSGGIVYFSF